MEARHLLASSLVISELVATGSVLRDADGDTSDWIEIHNPTDRPLGLLGWSLTDDPNDLTKWPFPRIHIAPGGYLTVLASGKDRAEDSSQLRCDFNGTKDGTFLMDLATGVYDVVLMTGDTDRPRDQMIVSIQGQPHEPVATAAGEFVVRTYRAEVHGADAGRLALQITDTGGQTGQSVINALVVTPVDAGPSRWFDFGTARSPVEPGFTRVTAADTYTPEAGYGWQPGDTVMDQARDIDPNELHANFKLASAGEYLALVEPDGSTIACQYAPQYPPQELGVSYGLEQAAIESTLIAVGTEAAVLVPTETNGGMALGTNWTEIDFDDSSWTRGPTGVGYERGEDLVDLIATDLDSAMFGVNATAYLRIPFSVDRPEKIYALLLRLQYDDGYVAYVNGTEVARANAPDWPRPDSKAETPRADSAALEFEDADISPYGDLLRSGTNLLAIQVLNRAIDDEDVLIVPELLGLSSANIESTTGRYFATPTPGGPNGEVSFGRLTAAPTVSVAGGLFDSPFDVHVTHNVPGATLVFTTDGSRPTRDTGVLVAAPSTTIPIAETTVLRAAAFQGDAMLSPIVNRTYIFPADIATQDFQATVAAGFPAAWGASDPDYGLDPRVVGPNDLFDGIYAAQLADSLKAVPTLSIVMDSDALFDANQGIYSNPTMSGYAWERPTSLELVFPDGSPGFQVDAGIRLLGALSRTASKKKSFRLEFRGEYGPTTLQFPLFGAQAADEFDTLVLRANFNDSWTWTPESTQYIRDEWTRSTQLAMGQPSAHGTFVHVYINGFYWGLYNLVERPDASFSSTYLGGDVEDWDALNSGSIVDGTHDAWRDLLTLAADVDVADQPTSNAALLRLLGRNPDGSDNPECETLLDIENYVDYMILNFFTANTDWPGKNYRVARMRGPDSTGFQFYSWDAERSLNDEEGADVHVDLTQLRSGVAAINWQLSKNDEYRLMFADQVHRHFFDGGLLYVDPENPVWDAENPQRNVPAARYKELADQVALPLVAESARWGDARRPQMPLTVADWRRLIDEMLQNWLPQRSAIVLNQLISRGLYPQLAAPQFNQHGGEIVPGFALTMTAPGDIYYTLDGSDPRQSVLDEGVVESGVSPRAIRYNGPIALAESATVKARTFADGQWSALAETHLRTGIPPLRLSEVMYHPHDPAAGSPFGEDDFEFLELVNVSDTAGINLEGIRLTQGVEFTFPAMTLAPGQHVVVVRNMAAFTSRYGVGILVGGQYGGTPDEFKLSDRGEVLRLEDATGALIQEFAYDDTWYRTTDGDGFSLEVIAPAQGGPDHLNQASAWLPSIAVGGTPGAARSSAAIQPGDANLDGRVDTGDIAAFVLGLASPDTYQARYGVPAARAGDIDHDDDLDFDDIDDFVAMLVGDTPSSHAQSLASESRPSLSPRGVDRLRDRKERPATRLRDARQRRDLQAVDGDSAPIHPGNADRVFADDADWIHLSAAS